MPISPIEIFRPQNLDGVGQILAGSNNALTNALNNSVQIGREQANLRATQEKEFLAEREKATLLEQRRVEFLKRSAQVDAQFGENVLQDRRNFAEDVGRDRRDFAFEVSKDERDANLRRFSTISSILNTDRQTAIEQEKLDLEKTDKVDKQDLLKKRASDILDKTKTPGFIAKLFGAEDPLPEDSIALGRELKDIGVTLKDPTLLNRGDELISKGTKGQLTRREDIRNTPLPARPSTRKADQTDEERIVELARTIKAYEDLAADPNADDLSNSDLVKKKKAELELAELQKKLADKPGSKPVEPSEDKTKSFADRIREKYSR